MQCHRAAGWHARAAQPEWNSQSPASGYRLRRTRGLKVVESVSGRRSAPLLSFINAVGWALPVQWDAAKPLPGERVGDLPGQRLVAQPVAKKAGRPAAHRREPTLRAAAVTLRIEPTRNEH